MLAALAFTGVGTNLPTVAGAAVPVTVSETETNFTLANGIVTACVSKRTGDLTSLQYNGRKTLNDKSGHPV